MILSNKDVADIKSAMASADVAFEKIAAGDTNLTTAEAANIANARSIISGYLNQHTTEQ